MTHTLYKITNSVNGKIYIGQTKQSLSDRLCKHFYDSTVRDSYFSRAIKKYGKGNFKIEAIDFASSQEDANKKEIFYINLYRARNREIGYNTSCGGDVFDKTMEEIAKHCHSKKRPGKFLGVGFDKQSKRIFYKIAFLKTLNLEEKVSGFASYEEAAMARDIRILELFGLDDGYLMLNLPELIGIYLSGEIKIKRIVKERTKRTGLKRKG